MTCDWRPPSEKPLVDPVHSWKSGPLRKQKANHRAVAVETALVMPVVIANDLLTGAPAEGLA